MCMKFLVLVIEDQKNISNFISMALTTNNYQVVHTETGKGGLAMVEACSPDVILLDLGLPDMDGLEVLKHIRERSDTPVIVDSADGNTENKIKVLGMGADYLAKPFKIPELLARLETIIQRRHL